MTTVPVLPSYQEVATAIQEAGSDFDASQLHGLFCGLICATSGEQAADQWKALVFGKDQQKKDLEVLEHLYEMSYHLLSEFSFEFSLLLPTDTKDINLRTEELGLWCQGFLSGMEQCHTAIAKNASEDVKDALNDLIEIAQVNFGDIIENEEDESAYFEVMEYVRLCVLMIFQDLKADQQSGQLEEGLQ